MYDLLLMSGSTSLVCYLIMLSRTTKNIEIAIRLSNAFVALACFSICFSYSKYASFFTLPWKQISMNALFFDFGVVAFLVGIFIMFIEMLKDPIFKYSPYVIIIGMSLLTIFADIAKPLC